MAGQNTTGGMDKNQNPSSQNQASQNQSSQNQASQTQNQGGSQSQYWKGQFQNEPYYQQGRQFEDYEQAYNTGEQGRSQYGSSGQSFDQSEKNLRADYEKTTGSNSKALKWEEGGKHAAQAAWERAGQSQSSDRDMQQGNKSQASTTDSSANKRTS